jgi:hypothetical protein
LPSALRPYRISIEWEPLLIRNVDSIVPGAPGTGLRWTRVSVPPAQTRCENLLDAFGHGGRDDGGEIGDKLRADVGAGDELIE